MEKATHVFARNKLDPLMTRFQELNDWIGEAVIRFEPYIINTDESSGNG